MGVNVLGPVETCRDGHVFEFQQEIDVSASDPRPARDISNAECQQGYHLDGRGGDLLFRQCTLRLHNAILTHTADYELGACVDLMNNCILRNLYCSYTFRRFMAVRVI